MTAKIVRQYFTQDLSNEEKKSYLSYINGNESSDCWIEKALLRREPLLVVLENIKCNICKEKVDNIRTNNIMPVNFHIDHIMPISAGGSNDDDNLQVLCLGCHQKKT